MRGPSPAVLIQHAEGRKSLTDKEQSRLLEKPRQRDLKEDFAGNQVLELPERRRLRQIEFFHRKRVQSSHIRMGSGSDGRSGTAVALFPIRVHQLTAALRHPVRV